MNHCINYFEHLNQFEQTIWFTLHRIRSMLIKTKTRTIEATSFHIPIFRRHTTNQIYNNKCIDNHYKDGMDFARINCFSKAFSSSFCFFSCGSFVFTFRFSSNIHFKSSRCWSIGIGFSGSRMAGVDVDVWPSEAVDILVDGRVDETAVACLSTSVFSSLFGLVAKKITTKTWRVTCFWRQMRSCLWSS